MRRKAKETIEMRKLELSLYRQLALAMLSLALVAFPYPIMWAWNIVPFFVKMGYDAAQGIAGIAAMLFAIPILTEKYEPVIWECGAPIKTPRLIKRLRRNFRRR